MAGRLCKNNKIAGVPEYLIPLTLSLNSFNKISRHLVTVNEEHFKPINFINNYQFLSIWALFLKTQQQKCVKMTSFWSMTTSICWVIFLCTHPFSQICSLFKESFACWDVFPRSYYLIIYTIIYGVRNLCLEIQF